MLIACFALALFPPFLVELWHDYSGVYYLYASRWNYILSTSLLILLFALGLACLTHYVGRLRRFLFIFLMLVLSFLGVVNLVHVALYDAPISVGAVDALLGTDLHEAVEYLTFHWTRGVMLALAVYGLLFLAVVAAMWRLLGGPRRCCRRDHLWAWPVLLALMVVVYRFPGIASYHVEPFKKKPLWSQIAELNRQVPSIRIFHDVGNWLAYRQWLEEVQQVRVGNNFGAALVEASRPRTVVIVIGESLRRDRMSVYGYGLPTTPHLDGRRKQLLLFNRAISPSNQTVPSLTKMMTPATVQEPDRFLTEPSILNAAKNAGYRTYWLSNQGRVGAFDSLISLIAHDAETTIFTNTEFYGTVYDEALLYPLGVVLKEEHPHKFIVLHLLGSHQNYRNRYPPENAHFAAESYFDVCSSKEEAQTLAEYDNSVRYTDEVLEEILKLLEKQPDSVLLFVSDHGERLFDKAGGTCGHGFPEPRRLEFDIPYFLWCNGGCPKAWKRSQSRQRDVAFSTENLFHTAANLLGLEMEVYRAQDDILNPRYLPVRKPLIIDVNRRVRPYFSLP